MTKFEIPDDDAPDEEKQAALDRLNAVRITGEQLKRAFLAWQAELADPSEGFCRAEGLFPVDVAAYALGLRLDPLIDAFSEVDLRHEPADYFEPFARDPIEATIVGLPLGAPA